MATLIDEPVIETNENITDLSKETQETAKSLETQEAQVDELPEKYQGKSQAEIVRMHQEAEKLIGKQSGEVGELRRVVDDFILQSKSPTQAQEPAKEIDFFENPKDAVNQAVQNHPDVVEARNAAQSFKKQTAIAQLQTRHPDMADILTDTKFQEWVKGSKVRQEMLRQADIAMDYEIADEIFTSWKERQNLVKQTVRSKTASRKKTVNQASTGSANGSAEQSNKKVYRRADIIKLMQTDPDRYEALQPELMQAYSDGRVR